MLTPSLHTKGVSSIGLKVAGPRLLPKSHDVLKIGDFAFAFRLVGDKLCCFRCKWAWREVSVAIYLE